MTDLEQLQDELSHVEHDIAEVVGVIAVEQALLPEIDCSEEEQRLLALQQSRNALMQRLSDAPTSDTIH